MKELILLVEPDGANRNGKLRTMIVTQPVNAVIENCQLDPRDRAKVWTRTWICTNDERAQTGQRVFREKLAPVKEEVEKPLYDELVLKTPLTLGVDGATFKKMAKIYGKK